MPPSLPCTVPDCEFAMSGNHTSEVARKMDCPARPAPKPEGIPETTSNCLPHEQKHCMRQTDVTLTEELWYILEPQLRELAFREGFEAMLGALNSLASIINSVSTEESEKVTSNVHKTLQMHSLPDLQVQTSYEHR